MNTSPLDSPGAPPPAGQVAIAAAPAAGSTDRAPFLLSGLWLATAIGLVVAPFLSQYGVITRLGDDVREDYSVNGWGQVDGLVDGGVREAPVGILFAVVAALLVLAVVATIGSRGGWAIRIGLLASTMGITLSVLQLLRLEATRLMEEGAGGSTFSSIVTIGPAAWLMLAVGVLAAVAVALSIDRLREHGGSATPEAASIDRPPTMLIGLCLVAAVVLTVAPLLSFVQAANATEPDITFRIYGWDREFRSVGVPCMVLSHGLAVATIAIALRRSAAWPLRVCLLTGAAAVTVAGFHLIGLLKTLAAEDSSLTVSIGLGGWLILTAGVLAAVTAGLALVRQLRLGLD